MTKRHLHIYWFSGSGNTLQAATVFAERLRQLEWTVELRALECHEPQRINPEAVLGLAFPTHCFTIPEIVLSFVRSLPQVDATSAMMLGTHGAFSGGVVGPMKRELTLKGFRCTAAKILPMPDSFFPFQSDAVNCQKLNNALDQAERYAEEFAAGTTRWNRWAIVSDIYATCFRSVFLSRKWSRKYFTTIHVQQERCSRCGLCARFCPVNALKQKPDSSPYPTKSCTNCLRCVALCPNNAMRHMIGFHPYRSEESALLKSRFEKETAQ